MIIFPNQLIWRGIGLLAVFESDEVLRKFTHQKIRIYAGDTLLEEGTISNLLGSYESDENKIMIDTHQTGKGLDLTHVEIYDEENNTWVHKDITFE